jgi:hypothetical protein
MPGLWAAAFLLCAACPKVTPGIDQDFGPADLSFVFVPDIAGLDLLSCPPSCAVEGVTQCTTSGKVQTCTRVNGCLAWSTGADCATNQLCCQGRCVTADEQNCWACGTVCGGAQPSCSATKQKCVCTTQACAQVQRDCDPNLGLCVTCVAPSVPETRSDLYVDANASATPTGSQGCPYKTISDALPVAGSSQSPTRTIHLAAGTYSTNEIFPIVVRNGISIVGAGAGTTTIQGHGTFNASTDKSQIDLTLQATIVIGSDGASAPRAQTLSFVTLLPATATPPRNTYGVLCDRGNALPRPSPAPSPNVTLKGLTIGPGYGIGVVETNSTPATGSDSGCNLLLLGNTVTGVQLGLWGLGQGLSHPVTTGVSSHDVALQLGDNSVAGANHFTNIRDPNLTAYPFNDPVNHDLGAAFNAWDGVTPVRVLKNTVDHCDAGLIFSEHPADHTLDIENNTFDTLSNLGVVWFNSAIVDQLVGNSFTNIGGSPTPLAPFSHCAVCMDASTQLRKARNNKLVGNQIGLEITGNGMNATTRPLIDFGTGGDAGGNALSCNSNGTNGTDVWIHLSSTSDGTQVRLAGNTWDHATLTTSGDGADLLVSTTTGTPASTDTSNASPPATMCPNGKVQ